MPFVSNAYLPTISNDDSVEFKLQRDIAVEKAATLARELADMDRELLTARTELAAARNASPK